MATALPSLTEVTHLFTMLFGHDTVCKPRKTFLSQTEGAIVASYFDNDGTIKRLLTCDVAFANSAGAALSAIPAGAANSATRDGEVPDNILANLLDVMNVVVVNLFTGKLSGGRLELGSAFRLSDLTPETYPHSNIWFSESGNPRCGHPSLQHRSSRFDCRIVTSVCIAARDGTAISIRPQTSTMSTDDVEQPIPDERRDQHAAKPACRCVRCRWNRPPIK